MTYEEWLDNTSRGQTITPRMVFAAGAASRDAEVAELKQEHINCALSLDECEQERDQLRAELEAAKAEIEQLSKSCLYEAQQWAKWSAEKNLQLAAEQAKNAGLREALEYSIKQVPELATVPGISKAISAPPDTSVLEAIVKKAGEVMRENCITAAGPEDSYQDDWIRAKADACDAIRALPAVTLEDLK